MGLGPGLPFTFDSDIRDVIRPLSRVIHVIFLDCRYVMGVAYFALWLERSMHMTNLVAGLQSRRVELRMSCAVLASRSGVSLRTVQRLLAGEELSTDVGTLAAIAEALGLEVRLGERESADAILARQAREKAGRLVSLTRGTAVLEAGGVAAGGVDRMLEKTTMELLWGSARRLWAS